MQRAVQLSESHQELPLGTRLSNFRISKGFSQAELAQLLGIKEITLLRWETGSTRPSQLAAKKLHKMGFHALSIAETNSTAIPRLKSSDSAFSTTGRKREASTHAALLKEQSIRIVRVGRDEFRVIPAPFVRNGPPDQIAFHTKLLQLQFDSTAFQEMPFAPERLSCVESFGDFGTTAQHNLEKPRPLAVSWNSNYGPHGWHRYVGRFPPHVVRALLNHFGANEKTVVCDPFAGSGTTAVECRLLGIPFIGVEICPLSCLMTLTKSSFPFDQSILHESISKFSSYFEEKTAAFQSNRTSFDHDQVLSRVGNPVPTFSNIKRWFTPEALLGVSIAVEFALTQNGFARDAVLLAISSKMRSIGNVDVDVVRAEYSRTPRANVDVKKLVIQQLKKMAINIAESVSTHRDTIKETPSITLHEGSVLDVELPDESIDHVITSPPYGVEAISYLRTHLLSYRSLVAHLKHDPYDTRAKTIGSEYLPTEVLSEKHDSLILSPSCRQFYEEASNSPGDARYLSRLAAMLNFFDDMYSVGQKLSRWLRDDGALAFIIGNKRVGDHVAPADRIVAELFSHVQLELIETIRHKLKTNNSNSQVPWQERIIQEESILIFRRMRRRV